MLEFIISGIPDLLREFFNWFLDNSDGDFPNVLRNIGTALLTILIPVATFIFKSKREGDFEILDRNVILEHVIDARRFLVYLALVYVPLLFWSGSSYPFRIVEMIVWFVGVCFLGRVLFKLYRWMKGEKSELRYGYLKKLKNPREIRESWHSVWEIENIDEYSEKEFFTIFSSTIDKFLRGDVEKIKIALGLINDFNSFIDKRSSFVLVFFEENFSKILEWHFFIWEKAKQPRGEKDNGIWGFYHMLLRSLSSTLKKIEEKELKENAFYFFVAFEPHVEKYKERFVEREQGMKKYYVEAIMSDFFDALVKNIENHENGQKIWGDFPSEWKITSEKIRKRESYVSRSLYTKFIYWTRRRILSSKEYDKTLNDVAYYLFPCVCPIMWANILTFLMSGWESGKRMKSLIEGPLIFGGIGRSTAGWMGNDEEAERKAREDMEKQSQAEEEETISLALFLFGGDFTQDNLKNYIAELEALESTPDSKRFIESVKREYTYLFGKLLEARRKKDVEK